jgi:hypothetical protein
VGVDQWILLGPHHSRANYGWSQKMVLVHVHAPHQLIQQNGQSEVQWEQREEEEEEEEEEGVGHEVAKTDHQFDGLEAELVAVADSSYVDEKRTEVD